KPSNDSAVFGQQLGGGRANGRRRVTRLQGRPEPIETAMTKTRAIFILSLVIAAAAVTSYGYSHRSVGAPASLSVAAKAYAAERTNLYYREAGGAPFWGEAPKEVV